MNWIVRLDVIVLGLMLACVIVIVGRVCWRRHYALRAGQIDSATGSQLAALLSTDLGSLKAIASGAPYLGLAGTCPGIMSAIVFGGNMDNSTFQAMLGARVAAALVTTAAGILVAVPATFSYNYLCTLKDSLQLEASSNPPAHINRYRQSTPRRALTKRFSQLPSFAMIAAPCMAAVVLVYSSFSAPRGATGLDIELAPVRCQVDSIDRPIVLHITDDGKLFLNTEQQDWNSLAGLLSDVYRTRARRRLYLIVEDGVAFETVADVLDIVENIPITETPQAVDLEVEKLDIRVQLITPAVIRSQCPALVVTASGLRATR